MIDIEKAKQIAQEMVNTPVSEESVQRIEIIAGLDPEMKDSIALIASAAFSGRKLDSLMRRNPAHAFQFGLLMGLYIAATCRKEPN